MTDLTGSDHILRLPSAPVYMTIMRTIDGKPFGEPIWNSFVHKGGLSLENENISSTLISLSKNIANLSSDKKGKVVRLTLEEKSYNIYLPGDEKLQISFVIVFESSDTVLIDNKHKEELVMLVVDKLKKLPEFISYLSGNEVQIRLEDPLYRKIQDLIGNVITEWDKKRVKYLMKKEEEERKRLAELAKKELKEQLKREKAEKEKLKRENKEKVN